MKNKIITTYAAKSDLDSDEFTRLLAAAQEFEIKFLDKENLIRDSSYKWPKSAINNWGRIWEYPYVKLMLEEISKSEKIENIADVGSGITFFPLWLSSAKNIKRIYTIDNDKICVNGNNKIQEVFANKGGEKIVPILSDGLSLGDIPDGSLDLAYSVSVIEHIDEPNELIENISRKLKTSGILILTIDIALRNDFGIKIEEYRKLMTVLNKYFKVEGEVRNIHPMDMLTSINSPIKSELRSIIGRIKGVMNDLIKGKLREQHSDFKLEIACYGIVMRKK